MYGSNRTREFGTAVMQYWQNEKYWYYRYFSLCQYQIGDKKLLGLIGDYVTCSKFKIHHQASFARQFFKPSRCFHVVILFIFANFGINTWQNLKFAFSKGGLVVILASLLSSRIVKAIQISRERETPSVLLPCNLTSALIKLIHKTFLQKAPSKTAVIELTEWLSTNASVLSTMSCSPSCCCSRRWSEYGTAADLVEDKTPLLNIFWETAKWKVGQSRYLFWCLFSQQYPYWAYQARYTLMELSFMLSFWATFWFVQQQALCTFQCLDRSRSLLLTR